MNASLSRPVIATVTSGKGGVGKTFITVNLASMLAAQGRRTLVVDCDFGLANVDILLGIHPEVTLKDILFGEAAPEEAVVRTKAGFDLLPACSGVRDMARLLQEKILVVKSAILSLEENYDVILLDTGAGIAETVLQFNLIAERNIVVLNRELTSMTDAYAMMKVMFQVFRRDAFSLLVNSAADDHEAEKLFRHMDGICRRFLGFAPDYLGAVYRDDAVPVSIVRQEPLVLSDPRSRTARCFSKIAREIHGWTRPTPARNHSEAARGIFH